MGTLRRARFEVAGTPSQVLARMADPVVAQARVDSTPALHARVLELGTDDAGRLAMTMQGSVPMEWVPAAIRGRVTAAPTITRAERWEQHADGSASTDVDLTISGVPAQASGSARLEATASGSLLSYEIGVEIAVPLVGSMIEGAVLGKVMSALGREIACI